MSFYRLHPTEQRALAFDRLLEYLRDVVGRYHPYLRAKYREAGVNLARLHTYRDFCRLPLLTKDDLRADPRAFILQPKFPGREDRIAYDTERIARRHLLRLVWRALRNRPREFAHRYRKLSFKEGKVGRRAAWEWFPIHFHVTSGTTGEPLPAVYTMADVHEVIPQLAAQLYLRPDQWDPAEPVAGFDTVALNAFPGVPHLAFFQAVLSKLMLGAACFDTGGGKVMSTQRQIQLFQQRGFHSLAIVPSYFNVWLRLAKELHAAGQVGDFPNFQHAVLGGEPASVELKAHFRAQARALGVHPRFKVIESYGSTESRWAFLECAEQSGIHLNPKFYFWELLDPATREPVGEGEPGVLTFTHVGWRGTVLARYYTGDLIQGGMRWRRCPQCGYTFPAMFGPIARAEKDFTKIRGARVSLHALIGAVRDTAGVRNLQIRLETDATNGDDGFGRDMLVLRVLAEDGAPREPLADALRRRVKDASEVTPDRIDWVEDAAAFEAELFARNGVKADYVVETRRVHV